jgi:choice-of-anchor C domain-containing protein
VTCADDGDICTVERCDPSVGETGACVTDPNPNPPEPGTEVSCADGLDNDCDGSTDFDDSDCPRPCPVEARIFEGFESPVIDFGNVTFQAGETIGDGWTVGQGTVDVVVEWEVAEGSQSIDLNGISTGSVYKDLTTTPGAQYRIQFALAGNPDGSDDKRIAVLWDGAQVADITFSQAGNTATSMGYLEQVLVLAATDASTRLEFRSLTGAMLGDSALCPFGPCYGPVIDNVRVGPAAPECSHCPCDAQGVRYWDGSLAFKVCAQVPTPSGGTAKLAADDFLGSALRKLIAVTVEPNGARSCGYQETTSGMPGGIGGLTAEQADACVDALNALVAEDIGTVVVPCPF